MSSNARKKWSGTIKALEQKRDRIKRLIKFHIEEDKKLSQNEPLDEARIKRATQAAESLTTAHNKIEKILKTAEPRTGKGKQKKEVKSITSPIIKVPKWPTTAPALWTYRPSLDITTRKDVITVSAKAIQRKK